MATVLESIESDLIGILISTSKTNQPAIEAWIASGEAEVQTELVTIIKLIPSVKGALALVVSPIEAAVESAVEAYVSNLVAKETPASLFAIYLSLLTKLQSEV